MRRTPLAIAILLAALPTFGALAADRPAVTLPTGREAFDLDLPPDCQVKGGDPKADFEIYEVTCGRTPYVGVYTGNAPRTDFKARTMMTPFGWPSRVQVWTHKVPKDQARADRIAASVQVTARRPQTQIVPEPPATKRR